MSPMIESEVTSAAARLPDEAERAAGLEREAQSVTCSVVAFRAREIGLEAAHLEERRGKCLAAVPLAARLDHRGSAFARRLAAGELGVDDGAVVDAGRVHLVRQEGEEGLEISLLTSWRRRSSMSGSG